jgi:uncharacterized Zn finger protein
MEVPGSLYLECQKCGEYCLHEVLRGRVGSHQKITLSCTVKCTQCGAVRKEVVEEEKPQKIRIIVSDRNTSIRSSVEYPKDEIIHIDDIFMFENYEVKVTSIETGPKRPRSAKASQITTLWAIRYDYVYVPVSYKMGERTTSREIRTEPKDDFSVGDEIRLEGERFVIEKIKIAGLTVSKPGRGAFASEIQRIYVKKPRERPVREYRRRYKK